VPFSLFCVSEQFSSLFCSLLRHASAFSPSGFGSQPQCLHFPISQTGKTVAVPPFAFLSGAPVAEAAEYLSIQVMKHIPARLAFLPGNLAAVNISIKNRGIINSGGSKGRKQIIHCLSS